MLVQLEEFLYQQQLTRDWSPSPSSRTGPVQGEGSLGFQHLWSVLSFLFCITESVDNLSHSTDNLTQRWVDSATTNTNYTAALHYRDRTLISSHLVAWRGMAGTRATPRHRTSAAPSPTRRSSATASASRVAFSCTFWYSDVMQSDI